MMLKIVYGPPPADAERIEAFNLDWESCIREEQTEETTALPEKKRRKGVALGGITHHTEYRA